MNEAEVNGKEMNRGERNQEGKIPISKVICSLLALLVLVAAQLIALTAGNLLVMLHLPVWVGNVVTGILYVALTLLGLKALCERLLQLTLRECKIPAFHIKPVWAVSAVLMPLLVSGCLLLAPGEWSRGTGGQTAAIVTAAVFFFGLGAGFVEEAIFRGVIMTALEKRWGKGVAIFVPSLIFGFLHIMGNDLNFLSVLQLLAAGTAVGILFSLVTYESGGIWCSAVIHGLWNVVMVGGILHIGAEPQEGAIFNYVLREQPFWITGGDFGVEASVPAVIAYLLFSALALWLLRRKRERQR